MPVKQTNKQISIQDKSSQFPRLRTVTTIESLVSSISQYKNHIYWETHESFRLSNISSSHLGLNEHLDFASFLFQDSLKLTQYFGRRRNVETE